MSPQVQKNKRPFIDLYSCNKKLHLLSEKFKLTNKIQVFLVCSWLWNPGHRLHLIWDSSGGCTWIPLLMFILRLEHSIYTRVTNLFNGYKNNNRVVPFPVIDIQYRDWLVSVAKYTTWVNCLDIAVFLKL